MPEPERQQEPLQLHEPVAAEPAASSGKWWVDESETTVGGPSFLGLSSADASEGGGYSYLFQGEEERSHKAAWVFLLAMALLAGVAYARWEPIRDYVLTTALSHSRAQKAPQQTSTNAGTEPGPAAPAAAGTTMASSDAPAPPITREDKTDQTAAAPSKAADSKEGLPEPDKPPARESVKSAAKQPDKERTAVREEASADEEDAPAADEEKPSAAKKARAAPLDDGGELVSSGERYLYGRGVSRSCNQAVIYFNAAAAKQNPQAFSHLGALYATGECVPMDRAVAYAWFRRAYAKEPANHYFEQNLTMLWREMTADEKQRATGKRMASF